MSVVPGWLSDVSLVSGPLPILVDAMAVAAVLAVLLRRGPLRWPLILLGSGALGAAVGLFLCWFLSDRLDLFEVSLSPASRAWVASALGATGLLVAGLVRGGALRRTVAAVGIAAALLAGSLGVNADFGQYTTIGSLSDQTAAADLPAEVLARQEARAPGGALPGPGAAARLDRAARPGDQPQRGMLGRVTIPATESHFAARPAYVYLPPRALVAGPPRLPVLVLLSGQPGGPDVMVRAGQVQTIFDRYAAAHEGLAPIVVIPDQLSAPQINPMCVDSPLGNSASYLTRDVPRWILQHLAVQPTIGAWGIGGFSQGGTCTIQLGAGHPELFSALLDISGQVAPADGNLRQTIGRGFGGSVSAYRAALPETMLAERRPYRGTAAVFVSGQLDTKYGPGVSRIAAAARRAGMRVTRLVSPGTAHDWATVRWALTNALTPLAAHFKLHRGAR